MNIDNVASGRPDYFDRGPTQATTGWNPGGLAPHTQTQRASYTVPSNKKAYIENVIAQMWRSGAAAGVFQAYVLIRYIPNGGSSVQMAFAQLYNNAVGAEQSIILPNLGLMSAGDQLIILSVDAAADGVVYYNAAFKVTQFDA